MYSSGKYSGVVCQSAATNRSKKLAATIPDNSRRTGTVAACATAAGRGTETSTATESLSAGIRHPLNEGYFG